ncbi:MAG TPA: efflux RND transporter periplasmic adaptor subunit [bacterium]|nr:efflux RND transporter periplasmic adaptor subunit [bacterium]
MKKWKLLTAAVAVIVTASAIVLLSSGSKAHAGTATQSYDFATISRGTIESVVTSSGTLSVVSSVTVLAQMSGRLESVKVDYNDHVRAGQVLATINTDLLRLKAREAQASVDKAKATYDLQALALQNAQTLFAKQLLSEYDLKTAQSELDVGKAELRSAQASLEEIETEINQYAIITSPIDGIVLERSIDAGQTVVGGSSATSSSLFTIAGNLSSMQIEAQVDELDIGSIHGGQAVRFTVEADPGVEYTGTVKQIRLVPDTSNNVVYYSVIILAGNPTGTLLPGMTADVEFIKQKKDNVLIVPSAAFRFSPATMSTAEIQRATFVAGLSGLTEAQKSEELARFDAAWKATEAGTSAESKSSGGLSSLMGVAMPGAGGPPGFGGPGQMGGNGRGTTTSATAASASATPAVARKTLWYVDEAGKLAVRLVGVGASDDSGTELIDADDLEGSRVILKVKVQ